MKQLKIEYNDRCEDGTTLIGIQTGPNTGELIMATPAIGEDYWLFRVKLVKDQALLGFPKFGLLGVGFAIEDEDWNRNLPLLADADTERMEDIWDHIKVNKKYTSINKAMVMEALKLMRDTFRRFGLPRSNVERMESGSMPIPVVGSPIEAMIMLSVDHANKMPRKPTEPKELFDRKRREMKGR